MVNVCLKANNCMAFNMWGFTDRYSWIINRPAPPSRYKTSEKLLDPSGS